jgi:hypothetical protein
MLLLMAVAAAQQAQMEMALTGVMQMVPHPERAVVAVEQMVGVQEQMHFLHR